MGRSAVSRLPRGNYWRACNTERGIGCHTQPRCLLHLPGKSCRKNKRTDNRVMKVSIITISYNSASTIEDTIRSVVAQEYPDIEYIIIDGASKDSTLNVINRYREKIATVISEKDNGIYDAMNKGVAIATGDIVGILNSDDFYADSH